MAEGPFPSLASGIVGRPFDEQVAAFRRRLGRLVPTRRWDEMLGEAHDQAFMVAGAAKADLLSDLAAAVDRAIAEGTSLEAFRRDFRAIVERNGWRDFTGSESPQGIAWRTRVIYSTNAAASYAAGRQAQLRDGNFTLWVYRHNDSVRHPRPVHVSWDGLTLPPDHAFWQQHYPPNGWGCRCYVNGARSERGARRLGGDPNKPLPPNWNRVDPRSGAQVGIDRGWAHAPGASVAGTVAEMARKAAVWERGLAKNFMLEVPERQRDRLVRSYRTLPSLADDTRRWAERVKGTRGGAPIEGALAEPRRTFGLLTAADADTVARRRGVDVERFEYVLDQDEVRHILDAHGDEAVERLRDQRTVTPADFARLPQVLDAPDRVDAGGTSRRRLPVVVYEKAIDGERYVVALERRGKRRTLAVLSMYVKRRR